MKITLTAAQKIELGKQHKIERDKRVAERVKAVLLLAEGVSPTPNSSSITYQ
jgi:hypothetical protein